MSSLNRGFVEPRICISGTLPGEPEKVANFENLCHQEYLTDLNDSSSS